MTTTPGRLSAQFGAALAAHRARSGTSQRAAAKAAGMAGPTLRELEQGLANPTLARVESIADTFGLDVTITIRKKK